MVYENALDIFIQYLLDFLCKNMDFGHHTE